MSLDPKKRRGTFDVMPVHPGRAWASLGVAIVVLLTATPTDLAAGPPPGFVSLFNGEDLTGWKGLVADPEKRPEMSAEELAAAQVEADENMRAHWKVVDGVLQYDGKGANPCTVGQYGDFELALDWKINAGADSGIYLRGSPQVQIWDNDIGSGGLYNNQKNPKDPLVKADNPPGQWNTFFIRMVGERVTVLLNDKLVVDDVVLENYWNRDKPIYDREQIELQSHGNELWFRNIYVREITAEASSPVRPVGGPIRLFNGENLEGFYTWLADAHYEDPRDVFTVRDGNIHISGDGFGGLVTRQAYRDYHLVIEFKWGGPTYDPRKKAARDSGLLLHCHGPDGNFGTSWIASIEAQIIEGGCGDLLVLSGKHPITGERIPSSVTAHVKTDRDGEKVWDKKGEKVTVEGGRINWWGRDVDWADKVGFRGREDVESPLGEWTRMDVISDGGHLVYKVNGEMVNEAFDVQPDFGRILLQTEGAEILVRRWELWPLGEAPE